MPKSRVEFWQKKFDANISRDNVVRIELQDKGIKCLIVWECTLKRMKRNQVDCEKYLKIVEDFFKTKELFLEM